MPDVFQEVAAALGKVGLNHPEPGGASRLVIEKPFGRDRESARELDTALHAVFAENQIYRIDHYLGKETVQNVLALRFANAIFEPLWSRNYIDHVQVTVAETVGVEKRGSFYEKAGALRDIVQNHVMQVLSLTLMEPPGTIDADGIRDEKVKALRSVVVPGVDQVANIAVRAQYDSGWVEGIAVPGYRQEEGVSRDSQTETYVALKLTVDNWRWAGVPIYIRTGKRLPKRVTEVALQFKAVPHLAFPKAAATGPQPQRSGYAHPARRGRDAALRCEGPGAGVHGARRAHGLLLRGCVPRRAAGRLRTAPARRHGRRPHAVHTQGRGRHRLGDSPAPARRLGQRRGAARRLCGRVLGTAPGRHPHRTRRTAMANAVAPPPGPAVRAGPSNRAGSPARAQSTTAPSWPRPGKNGTPALAKSSTALPELRRAADGREAATRTAVLTIVMVIGPKDDPVACAESVRSLGAHHPCRAVVLRADPDSTPVIDASATLWRASAAAAEGHPTFFEELHLHVGGQAASHLSSIVGPFILADLPVAMWFPADLPDPTDPLLRLASVLMVDTRSVGPAGRDRPLLPDIARARQPPACR